MFLSKTILLALVGIVGCHARSHTKIVVRQAADRNEVDPLGGEVLEWMTFTANQFGLREYKSSFDHTSFPGIRMYESTSEEYPKLSMAVHFEELPLRIEIAERYPDRRSSKHRKLVDAIMTGLARRGFDASIVYQTPDPFEWRWIFLPVLGIAVAWILWKRSRRKQASI